MSKKLRRPRMLLAAIIFMIVAITILAQTIKSFTGENRSKAFDNSPPISKCVQEGGVIPVILNPPVCCDGLVIGKDPLKVGQAGYGGTCEKPVATSCAKVGEKISLVPSKNSNEIIKCCEGLGYTKLNSSTGVCITPKKCNQTCSSDTQCAEGLFCYKFVSSQNGVIDKSRSYSRCRSRVAKTNTSCPQYKKIISQ